MKALSKAIHEIHSLENLAERDTVLCKLHPLAKVLVTVWYLALVMSFGKKDLVGLAGMILYPFITMTLGDISIRQALKRLRPVLFAVCLIGAAEPFLNRMPCLALGGVVVTEGMLSMASLFLKAAFAAAASYILIATTTVEEVCFALRKLCMPSLLVTVILLIYRYLVLMLKEAERMTQAYALRAPGERGIRKSAWGSLAGQMLLRSMDRAQTVYDSMTLRGFRGEFYLSPGKRFLPSWQSALFALAWGVVIAVLRLAPVFCIVGGAISL